MDTFEKEIKDALKEIDKLRTPECLDPALIGPFAEGTLSGEEKQRAENHFRTCLYCLKQLNDMKELLYYRAHPLKLSPESERATEGASSGDRKKNGERPRRRVVHRKT